MSNIDAVASDLFATISAYIDKRVAAAVEKVLAEMQPRLDAIADTDTKRHEDALEEICTTDATVAELGKAIAELKALPPSKDGEPGRDGKDGIDGKDADPVDVGAIVKTVVAAIPAPKDGINGKDGEDGRDGRDAIQCDVLDVIDPERRYQRGTFAHYKGGRIRSFRATDPLGDGPIEKFGWTVDQEGIAEVGVEQGEDLRTFAVGVILTSGKAACVTKFTLPVMMYRGVFKAGTEYGRGDVTTWDGSSWHCEKETKSEPGNGADWKLIAKRGSPGKDGVSVKGDPGPPGANGKDLTHMLPDGTKYR